MADKSLVDTSGITAMENGKPFAVKGTKYDYEPKFNNPTNSGKGNSAAEAASKSQGSDC